MLALLIVLVTVSMIPKSWLPHDPTLVDITKRFTPPFWGGDGSGAYPLGTDALGRDLLSRIVYSAKYTLLIAGAATILSGAAGTVCGLLSGYRGGIADSVIMRVADTLLAFPVVLLVLALVAVLGASLANVVLVLALSGWAGYVRVIRSVALMLKGREFVEAARAVGASDWRILRIHLLPNVMSPILVLSTFQVARFVLTESAISFLGLGVPPPASTWGRMIGEGRNYLYDAWWVSAIPGIAIAATVLILNFLGDGMRDAYDPFSVSRA